MNNIQRFDFGLGADRQTLTTTLENGRYRVRINTGDPDDIGDVRVVFHINDKELCFWIHENEVLEKEISVDVTDGRLEITPEKARHICLNRVDAAPEIFLDKAEVKAETYASEEKCGVRLLWDTIPGASGYLLTRRRMSDNEIDITTVIKNTEFTDEAVSLCERFTYSVTPVDELEFACAEPSEIEVCVTDGNDVTDDVWALTADTEERSVSLSWQGTNGILCYNIYKKTPYGLAVKIAQTKECAFTDKEVVTCVPFAYSVEGITWSGATEKQTVFSQIKAPRLKRWMENINRGIAAVKADDGIFVSWRLRGWEYDKGISFIVLRNGERITDKPITECTCLSDKDGKPGDSYTVKAVRNGKAERDGETAIAVDTGYIPIPIDKPEPYTTPDGNTYEYFAHDVIPADLDGDGEYEYIVKWVANLTDNSIKGYTGVYYIDAYKLGGKKLWRLCLGRNIRCGQHYAQIMVYDFDNDGKAEIICKTADGTTDAVGTVIGDADADYRNSDGFIIEGPEYLSAFDGETGTLLDTVPYESPRGNVRDWGDSWGNRVDRFLACVAYLDGINPSAVMCRGYYDHGCPTVLAAYDLIDKKLKKRWVFRADRNQNINFTNQGNHMLAAGDVDGDGMDEIIYGSMMVDHDGRGIYSTGLGHGDMMHVGKFMPGRDGLQFFGIHEEEDAWLGYDVHDAATGEIKWGYYTGRDTERGMCAKIDPRYAGNQVWARNEQLYTFDGELITENAPKTCKFPVWWDGDLLRELLDYTPDEDVWQNGRPKVMKWNWEKETLETVFEPEGAKAERESKGTPNLMADVLGDWRENLVYTDEDCTELRIYVSTEPTNYRFYTFMHDHVYRLGIAFQNTAYNSPPHTGFYIGDDMEKPPVPESRYIGNPVLPEFTDEI